MPEIEGFVALLLVREVPADAARIDHGRDRPGRRRLRRDCQLPELELAARPWVVATIARHMAATAPKVDCNRPVNLSTDLAVALGVALWNWRLEAADEVKFAQALQDRNR